MERTIDDFDVLSLNSIRWGELRATSSNALLARSLLVRVYASERGVLDELFEQACHQFTASEAAYAIVPHLVQICATNSDLAIQIDALRIVGAVAAAQQAHARSSAPVPADLSLGFKRALTRALHLASTLVGRGELSSEQTNDCLATIAALRGNSNVALLLFLSGAELWCPSCGEVIDYGER